MIDITDKGKCCGCGACAMICPVSAISMDYDTEGFIYPRVNADMCIMCNKCNRICPMANESQSSDFQRKVYICQNKNKEIRSDSTSGGFFSALAQYVLEKGGYIFGAEFDTNWNVIHGCGTAIEDLYRFRGSKYIQSNLGNTYKKIQKLLDSDKWVLFTGTPCQIEGLYHFLGREYEKLILMDIVCFSISSPSVWSVYLQHLQKTGKLNLSKVNKIKFRDKTKYGYEYSLMSFYDELGNLLYSSGPESNQMLRSFVTNTSTRPSCYNCRFKKVNRISDFTAWDCYNVYTYDKQFDDNIGTSHIMVHSEKALVILEELNKYLRLKEIDIEVAVKSEPAMIECSKPSDMREEFFEVLKKGDDPFNSFFLDSLKVKTERFLRTWLSSIGLYKFVKRALKK